MSNVILTDLKQRWLDFKYDHPKTRIRDAATQLGVSEAELVATGLGDTAIRLKPSWSEMLLEFRSLGRVMALTRNNDVVHERHGVYNHAEVMGENARVALVLDPEIDLRIFFRHWSCGYAVIENSPRGERKSLQFFDKDGTAVHKVYMTEQSDLQAYASLVDTYTLEDQQTELLIRPVEKRRFNKADSEVDAVSLKSGWDKLQDTHDFYPLLQNLKIDRVQALRLAGKDRAYQLQPDTIRVMLKKAAASGLEIMVFVGSPGVIQIHMGRVETLKIFGDWYNVLDPEFNLHIRETGIDSTWLVKKPTADGQVTAVECYDKNGDQIVQFFGRRKPGIPELEKWRELADNLEVLA